MLKRKGEENKVKQISLAKWTKLQIQCRTDLKSREEGIWNNEITNNPTHIYNVQRMYVEGNKHRNGNVWMLNNEIIHAQYNQEDKFKQQMKWVEILKPIENVAQIRRSSKENQWMDFQLILIKK